MIIVQSKKNDVNREFQNESRFPKNLNAVPLRDLNKENKKSQLRYLQKSLLIIKKFQKLFS